MRHRPTLFLPEVTCRILSLTGLAIIIAGGFPFPLAIFFFRTKRSILRYTLGELGRFGIVKGRNMT